MKKIGLFLYIEKTIEIKMNSPNENKIKKFNYKDRFESASSLAPAQLLWYTYTDCRIDYIMTNKRNPVAKKLF